MAFRRSSSRTFRSRRRRVKRSVVSFGLCHANITVNPSLAGPCNFPVIDMIPIVTGAGIADAVGAQSQDVGREIADRGVTVGPLGFQYHPESGAHLGDPHVQFIDLLYCALAVVPVNPVTPTVPLITVPLTLNSTRQVNTHVGELFDPTVDIMWRGMFRLWVTPQGCPVDCVGGGEPPIPTQPSTVVYDKTLAVFERSIHQWIPAQRARMKRRLREDQTLFWVVNVVTGAPNDASFTHIIGQELFGHCALRRLRPL